MDFEELACRFACQENWLYGVLSLPAQARSRGVLIAVGGDQYRAGSHRQFALLARGLAAEGMAAMRFDFRGMGDSEGEARGFETVGDDLRCAVDHFFQCVPGLADIVIWGLCDAASAALFYAHRDRRVTGLVLLNPWVRTESGMAKTYIKHYYRSRLLDPAFWRKILAGRFDLVASGRSFIGLIREAGPIAGGQPGNTASAGPGSPASLPERMFDGYDRFNGRVLLILSGNDLTAQEFSDLVASSAKWRSLLAGHRTRRHDLPAANHTFSARVWRDQIGAWTRDWILSW